jgi:hypothetical protein
VTVELEDGGRVVREARAGGSYLSAEDPRLHFGLGDATRVDRVIVRYPGGKLVVRNDVAVDRVLRIAG